jgi:hypothetical protein
VTALVGVASSRDAMKVLALTILARDPADQKTVVTLASAVDVSSFSFIQRGR